MSNDDALFRFRLRLFGLAHELGNVRAACRIMGVHHSTYYRWKQQVERYGLDALRPRERRQPRMPNQTSRIVEHKVIAFALAYPGFGPGRISAELAQERWGGISISPNGAWCILRRHGISTRARRYGLIAGHAAPPQPARAADEPEQHIRVSRPGGLVQMDCFQVGRLSGTKGVLWQYTAIDAFSSHTWAQLRLMPNGKPVARWCSELAKEVGADLASKGWKMERVSTDNGTEYNCSEFDQALEGLGVRHTLIHPGRPQSNGFVERVQRTILEECWQPAFARNMVVKITGLKRDLEEYLVYYNTQRAHTGRWTRGCTPEQVLAKAKIHHQRQKETVAYS